MSEKKYVFVKDATKLPANDAGNKLHQIMAIRDFADVKAGDIGGYVQSTDNLSHYDNCWVYPHSKVYGNAHVRGNARVRGYSKIFGGAIIKDDAIIIDSVVTDTSVIYGEAIISDFTRIKENSHIANVSIANGITIKGEARIKNKDDLLIFSGLGSENRTTAFYRNKGDAIYVVCGCFYGHIDAFEQKVKKIHENDPKFRNEYLSIIQAARIHFGLILPINVATTDQSKSFHMSTISPLFTVNPVITEMANDLQKQLDLQKMGMLANLLEKSGIEITTIEEPHTEYFNGPSPNTSKQDCSFGIKKIQMSLDTTRYNKNLLETLRDHGVLKNRYELEEKEKEGD